VNGDRTFSPMFTTLTVRDYLLSYMVPEYMPGSLHFAFDGGGCFFLFDMRGEPVEDEYPILFVSAGNLGYEDAVLLPNPSSKPVKVKSSLAPSK
jgi:hypothetical protein